ncbi:hypothetical protein CEXT_560391 [Caerostris extrusa]|uniref:Uncharacterized protein n=1 Tax=Caerostris extrusa TaxID=172846 RepID=A0AAV4MIE2_CAEEX|nr:hypothetical protein CEXT_560391 [Caerostris extrusa]
MKPIEPTSKMPSRANSCRSWILQPSHCSNPHKTFGFFKSRAHVWYREFSHSSGDHIFCANRKAALEEHDSSRSRIRFHLQRSDFPSEHAKLSVS